MAALQQQLAAAGNGHSLSVEQLCSKVSTAFSWRAAVTAGSAYVEHQEHAGSLVVQLLAAVPATLCMHTCFVIPIPVCMPWVMMTRACVVQTAMSACLIHA